MKEKRYQIEDKNQQLDMNFFRGNYAGNKSSERDNLHFSSRIKEDQIKGKPRLLTGRLPAAFTVQSQRKESDGGDSPKLVLPNESSDHHPQYSTEGNISQPRTHLQKPKLSLMTPIRPNTSHNNDLQAPMIKDSFTRTKTESDEIDKDKMIFRRPIYLRGSTPSSTTHKSKSNNQKSTIESNIINGDLADNALNNDNNNTANSTRKIQSHLSANNFSKTHTFLPKLTMDEIITSKASFKQMMNNIPVDKFSLEHGFSYYSKKGLKYYYHVPSFELFILKETHYNDSLINEITLWNNNINNIYTNTNSTGSFIQIHQHFVNNPEGCISILYEYPFGYSLTDIIISTGIPSSTLLNKITRNCLEVISIYNKSNNNKDYGLYCPCDLYYNYDGRMKIIPNIIKDDQSNMKDLCECKRFLYKLSKVFKVTITQFFSLGFILLTCSIGNISLRVFDNVFNQTQGSLKCCLLHTLLFIERNTMNEKDNALLSHFISLFPSDFILFLCDLLSFDTRKRKISFEGNTWLNSSMNNHSSINLTMNELLKIVHEEEDKNNEKFLGRFIKNFYIVTSKLKGIKNIEGYLTDFKTKQRTIDTLCSFYDIDTVFLMTKIRESIIRNE